MWFTPSRRLGPYCPQKNRDSILWTCCSPTLAAIILGGPLGCSWPERKIGRLASRGRFTQLEAVRRVHKPVSSESWRRANSDREKPNCELLPLSEVVNMR